MNTNYQMTKTKVYRITQHYFSILILKKSRVRNERIIIRMCVPKSITNRAHLKQLFH